jgi:hypothetical protein|tara:strand:+ start:259 stop:471 length:213 start_codon:yes stop_codon:yes gene_type:complete
MTIDKEYTPPPLTVADIISHHVSDLEGRYTDNGGDQEGLDYVNQGTHGTPYFETEKEFQEYISEVWGLID